MDAVVTADKKRPAVARLMPPVIAKAIVEIQAELKPLLKSAINDEYGSGYVPLEEVTDKAIEMLNKHGIAVMQPPVTDDHDHLALTTMLIHKSGVGWATTTRLALGKADPQGHGSAITYQRRYSLMGVLGMTAKGEDDDGNKAAGVMAKATDEQREYINTLLRQLKWPDEEIAKVQRNIRTKDHAALATIDYETRISQSVREREAEAAALAAEKSTTHIDVTDGPSDADIKERLQKLARERWLIPKKIIHFTTGKPFLANCDAEDLEVLGKTIDAIERGEIDLLDDWYEDGHAPSNTLPAPVTDTSADMEAKS